ncbi:MAG: hypothetical protein J6J60_08270 [Clostridia bacterium]|nr:hypothetical protein [Clostridia bacterium]
MLISQTDLPTNVTTLYTYDKAGRKIKVTNTKQKVEYQFRKSYNANTGLNNSGFRDYSSSIGRFITSDPIRDGTNWYTLAVNNPINFVDLWGLCTNDEKPKSVWENYTGAGNPYATQMINRDKSTSGTKNPYEGIEDENDSSKGMLKCNAKIVVQRSEFDNGNNGLYYQSTAYIYAGNTCLLSVSVQSTADHDKLNNGEKKFEGGTLEPGYYTGVLLNKSASYNNAISITGNGVETEDAVLFHPDVFTAKGETESYSVYGKPYSLACQIMKLEDFEDFINILNILGYNGGTTNSDESWVYGDTISIEIRAPNKEL